MWHIKLVDIGGDGLVTDFSSNLDTLVEIEAMARLYCARHLGVKAVTLEHTDELVYSVWLNGHEIGVVVIKSVNAVPIKRKWG